MKGMFDKLILLFVGGGLLLAIFLFLIDWLGGNWTLRVGSGEYGFVAVKSWLFLYLGDMRLDVSFLDYVAFGMLALGGVSGLLRLRVVKT